MLALAAFALLGVTATKTVFVDAQSIVNKAFALFGLFGKTIYDAAVGFAVILRVLSGGILSRIRGSRV